MHPYERIADHYRLRIRDGALAPGARLPSIRDMAAEHDVASATIRHALSWLQNEGLVVSSPRGTFIAEPPRIASTPYDRIDRLRRTQSTLAQGEWMRVLKAELIVPPLYVADVFGLEPGDQIAHREYVMGATTTATVNRRVLAVDWYPAALAAAVPELLGTEPRRGDNLMHLIGEATGRRPLYGRDGAHARTADQREANHLGIPVGSALLAMAYEWSDDDGVLVYGEVCLPPRMDIGYDYRLTWDPA